jgi:Matrixin
MSGGAVRRVLLTTTVAAAGMLSSEVAQAYELGGKKWPTRTITYHASAPRFNKAIRAAVMAWNKSGVRIRFRPASRRRAQLQIVYGYPNQGGGLASLGWGPRSQVISKEVDGVPLEGNVPCGARIPGPSGRPSRVVCVRGPHVYLHRGVGDLRDPRARNELNRTVAHELGHVLGLQHVRQSCSVMTVHGVATCGDAPRPWQVRCRLLEADDVRGAIRRYGGRMRPLGRPLCDISAPPAAPSGLTARFVAEGRRILVNWTNAATASVRYAWVAIGRDVCPVSKPVDAVSQSVKPRSPGSTALEADDDGGRFCIAVGSADEFGRVSAPATVWVEVPRYEPPSRRPPGGEPDAEEPPE